MNEESKLKAISSAAMEEVRKSYNEDSALSSPGKDGGHPSRDSSPASDQKDIVSKSKIPAKRPKKKRNSKSSSSSERSEKSASVEKSDRRRNYRRPSYSPEKDSRDENGRSVKSKKAVRKSRVAHSSSHSRSPSCSRSKSCSPSRSSSKGRSPTPKAQRSAGKGSRTPPRKRSLSPGKKKYRPGRNRLASTSKSPSPGRSKAKKMSVPDNDVDKKPTERVNANGSAAEKVVVEAPTTAKPRNAIEEKLLSISNSKLSPSRSRSKTKSPFRRRSRSRSPLSKRRSKSPKRRRESPIRRRRDSRSPPKKRNRTPPSRKRSSRSPIRRKSSPRRRSRSRTRSRSASRSPVNRRRSPTPDRKRVSRSPVRRRRSASPIKSRRSRSPLKNRRSRSPSKNRRSRSPSKNRRSRSPSKNRRSRSPSKNQRSRSPSKNRRSRSPSKSRRSPTPDKTRRSRSKDRVGKDVEASSKPASKRNPYWGNRGIKRYRDSRSPSPEARYDTDAGFTRAVLPQQLKDATSSTRGSAAANKKERIVTTEEIEQRLAKHQKNLQDKAAEEARKINLPGYLNPAMVNVHQFKQVQEKRKLLWSKAKEKTDASQWAGAFDGDDSTDDKFRRLMGIHGDVKAAAASSTSQVLKSRQVLEDLEKEYEKSRAFQLSRGAGGLTGIGLGFGSAAPPGP